MTAPANGNLVTQIEYLKQLIRDDKEKERPQKMTQRDPNLTILKWPMNHGVSSNALALSEKRKIQLS